MSDTEMNDSSTNSNENETSTTTTTTTTNGKYNEDEDSTMNEIDERNNHNNNNGDEKGNRNGKSNNNAGDDKGIKVSNITKSALFNNQNSSSNNNSKSNKEDDDNSSINGRGNAYLYNNSKEEFDLSQTNMDEPRDARVIKNILKTMGVQQHDSRVVNQLMEFMYKYVYEVLQDSMVYSEHANKQDIDISDIRLSIQSRVNFSFTQPPPRELLLSISEELNKVPLPPIPNKFGILLPPDEYCLNYPNYQVDPPKQVKEPPQPLVGNTSRGQYNKKISDKQIPIKLSHHNHQNGNQ